MFYIVAGISTPNVTLLWKPLYYGSFANIKLLKDWQNKAGKHNQVNSFKNNLHIKKIFIDYLSRGSQSSDSDFLVPAGNFTNNIADFAN